jgi:DNA-binding NarL/FixJ family response regulator
MSFTAPAPAVRVLVVDDSLSFRQAMRVLVDATAGFEWIGDANCGETGVEQAARLNPDLVLMDVRMPGIGGVEAARVIASQALTALVVLISGGAPPDAASGGKAAEIFPKERLSPAALRCVWEERCRPAP